MVHFVRLLPGAILLMPLLFASIAIAEPVDIDADEISRSADGVVVARGHVVIKRKWDTLMADEVIYRTKQHVLEAKGHVVIKSAKSTIETDKAIMQTQSKTGHMGHAVITLPGGDRLIAERVRRIDDQTYEAEKIIYSSCPIDEESWRIAADHALLDQQEGSLTASHARFELWGLPVLYSPWWQQSLRRKTGFLIPKVATGKRRGTEISIPYYIATEPNWDMTITPRLMSARGQMGAAEIRHVSSMGYEEINFSGINDAVTHTTRSYMGGEMRWQLPANMQLSTSGDYVSDNLYVADYATGDLLRSSYLQSVATLSQSVQFRDFSGSWTLHGSHRQNLLLPSNASVLQILPRLQSRAQWKLSSNSILHVDQQSTRFSRQDAGVDGWRVNLHPYIEVPWQLEAGGLSAVFRAGLQHTRYWLKNSALADSNPSRTTREASLDVKFDFERIWGRNDSEMAGQRLWRHVISPLVRYDYVEAPDQSLLPNFDSGFGRLTWSNLLSGNHFSGFDRVEKTNRFSLLLENRLQLKREQGIAASDLLIVRGGITYDLLRSSIDQALQLAPARPFSNLLAELVWQPFSNMRLYSSGQYNPADQYWTNYNAAMAITIAKSSLNLAYQFTDSRYSTKAQLFSANATVDLTQHWQLTGIWQYDMIRKSSPQTSVGLQYRHPCWSLGVEAYKTISPTGTGSPANYGYSLLLEFKGLGSVGS